SPPFTGQSLSDISGKTSGQRLVVSRVEHPPLPVPTMTPITERKSTPLDPPLSFDATKREVEFEPFTAPESSLQATDNSAKEKETEQVLNAPATYGRRKSDLLKEETVHTLFSDLKRERKARFISFINFKGGVGKSTTAVETAASLAKNYGKR